MKIVTLFLAWQEPLSHAWFPIGRLTFDGTIYQFVYLQGAQMAQRERGFEPLPSFPDLEKVYESDEFFPLFSDRLLSRSQPDFNDFVQWLNLPQHKDDPIALLARSGGRRATDTFEVFPAPEPDENGQYHIHFFAHGLRHFPVESINRIKRLRSGERLLPALDFQNPVDPHALLLRTHDSNELFTGDRYLVGYCPRYLLDDAHILQRFRHLHVTVERVNPSPAPLQFLLLCNLTAQWPSGFRPFSSQMYQLIGTDVVLANV